MSGFIGETDIHATLLVDATSMWLLIYHRASWQKPGLRAVHLCRASNGFGQGKAYLDDCIWLWRVTIARANVACYVTFNVTAALDRRRRSYTYSS